MPNFVHLVTSVLLRNRVSELIRVECLKVLLKEFLKAVRNAASKMFIFSGKFFDVSAAGFDRELGLTREHSLTS